MKEQKMTKPYQFRALNYMRRSKRATGSLTRPLVY